MLPGTLYSSVASIFFRAARDIDFKVVQKYGDFRFVWVPIFKIFPKNKKASRFDIAGRMYVFWSLGYTASS